MRKTVICWVLAMFAALLLAACNNTTPPSSPAPPAPPSPPLPPPGKVNLTGKVLSLNSLPVTNAPVRVSSGAFSITTTSDDSGKFSASDVPTPYDVAVVNSATKQAIVYTGLTRPDPTLAFIGLVNGTTHTATVSGAISGGTGFPQPANHQTRMAYGTPEQSTSNFANDGNFDGPFSWAGGPTTTLSLHVLQWQGINAPVAYKGYGTRAPLGISVGGTYSAQDIVMNPVTAGAISGSVTVPSGYTRGSTLMSVVFADNASIPVVPNDTSTSSTFSYVTPNIPGASLRVSVGATKSGAFSAAVLTGIPANASGLSLTIPAAPELSAPAQNATGVNTATSFGWTAFAGGVHWVDFVGGTGQPSYSVLTAATTATIPELQSLGLPLPTSSTYQWAVIGAGPFANVDAAAEGKAMIGALTGTSTHTNGFSADRSFTTSP